MRAAPRAATRCGEHGPRPRPTPSSSRAAIRHLRWRRRAPRGGDLGVVTILLSDPRVAAVRLVESGEPLVALDASFGPARALVRGWRGQPPGPSPDPPVRRSPAPGGRGPPVGGRPAGDHRPLLRGDLRRPPGHLARPTSTGWSRATSPPSPSHPTWPGPPSTSPWSTRTERRWTWAHRIDATPEQSAGTCYFDADGISRFARSHRRLLSTVLTWSGFVNYPTEWWHWSYGDRYWALVTGAPAALHGPVEITAGAAA